MKFEDKPEIYNQFLDIMKEFKAQSIDTPGVIERVLQLFHGHRQLILGFNTFLPPGYKIEFTTDEDKPRVQLKYPQGMTGPQPQPYIPPSEMPQQPPPPRMPGMAPAPYGGQPLPSGPPDMPSGAPPMAPMQGGASAAANTKKAPIEFDQAINYVTKIKKTFEDKPGTYRAFLEILHTYQKEQKSIKDVYEEVSRLFKDHPELLGEFSQFLPDGSPEAGGGSMPPQAKGPKGKGAMDRGGGAQMKHQRPGAKTARQQQEEDDEHYWQKRKQNRKDDTAKRDMTRSPEAEFFSKCRSRMPKPLYLELLKCLNLYSQQVIDRAELLTLVHDLFKRTQIELFSNFRRLMGYSGDPRDAPSPPARTPVADGTSFRDLDFGSMKKHGTSYRILPDDYAQPACSGRGPLEQLVLNDQYVSVATGTEDLNFKHIRKNQYEEAIFRAEDERFELDTTIETNILTLHFLRPIKADIDALSEVEKRRFKLPEPLKALHCKAIRRMYGTQGNQVIELLNKCPAAAINPLIKRLTQKDEEWRALRTQLLKGWKETYEKNYTKSLDHRSFYFKQGDKKNFSGKQMVMELKGLCEAADDKDEEEEGKKPKAAPKDTPETSGASAEPSKGLSLRFSVKTSLEGLHDETLPLMIFAAKLSFSLVKDDEIEEKLTQFWGDFVRPFFRCPELEPQAEAMEVDASKGAARAKPLLVVSPDASEEVATREGRPPEQRWGAPLCYTKTSAQLFVGNSHFCIFARLYHVILERLAAAKVMASKSQEIASANGADDMDEGKDAENGLEDGAAATPGEAAATRAQLLASLRREANGDMYQAFLSSLRQLVEGKMEASVYEDVLRTLLGTDAYILFTLQKIISQALKQLQMVLVEETSIKLLELYQYERGRVGMGSFSEATYRSNARMLLEGDDCFQVEQLYQEGGGELLLQFLPEKEANLEDGEGEEMEEGEEPEDDEAAESAAAKAEWSAYMDSYVQVPAAQRPSSLLLPRTVRRTSKRAWSKAVLLNGLESRAAMGSCKLRFVTASEDLWYSNARRKSKREAAETAMAAKRQRFSKWLEQKSAGL